MHLEKYAVSAGLCAALASVFSKLAFENDSTTLIRFVCLGNDSLAYCEKVLFIVRAICFLMVIFSNVLMWLMFTKSLQAHTTTVQPTVINSASNFLFSSLFGWLLFSESLSLKWWVGFSLITSGLILIINDSKAQH